MILTDENKKHIDSLSYWGLLERWRYAPVGEPWFQGATAEYWATRMMELRSAPGGEELHVSVSKDIGWDP